MGSFKDVVGHKDIINYIRSAVEKAVRDGRVYQCSGECEGLGQYPQRYGAYPWALGTALML